MTRTGVLLTAFGGPDRVEDVAPFMCSIMGRQPSAEAVSDACERYEAIGGGSPLPAMARKIADSLAQRLSADEEVPVAVGMLHSHPTIAAAMSALADAGVQRIVSLALSPFEAESTTGSYRRAVESAAKDHPGIVVVESASYNGSEEFVAALADRATAALRSTGGPDAAMLVALTAHSLPVADVEADPSYVDQLRQTAEAVAVSVGLGVADGFARLPAVDAFGGHSGDAPWLLAFQSKGRRGGAWIGPGLDDVIDLAAAAGIHALVVLPIGFAVDHMETLYDLDVSSAGRARDAGLVFARAAAPNDADKMIDALAASVRGAV
jgi:ferrochelatase